MDFHAEAFLQKMKSKCLRGEKAVSAAMPVERPNITAMLISKASVANVAVGAVHQLGRTTDDASTTAAPPGD